MGLAAECFCVIKSSVFASNNVGNLHPIRPPGFDYMHTVFRGLCDTLPIANDGKDVGRDVSKDVAMNGDLRYSTPGRPHPHLATSRRLYPSLHQNGLVHRHRPQNIYVSSSRSNHSLVMSNTTVHFPGIVRYTQMSISGKNFASSRGVDPPILVRTGIGRQYRLIELDYLWYITPLEPS